MSTYRSRDNKDPTKGTMTIQERLKEEVIKFATYIYWED